ncbi:MAG TPA: LytTR family DNA-binding domain-containing protein [Saprospiraceae bacterium]|nr:LytTR family DNA-binding domain-containing protein [Saprospiraceae bacterium]HMQ84914.1 LytTR family DNA-binding domain-containing protein [Saprospiraceae bacterium]
MKAYLIDDEINCTEVLQVLLEKYCPSVKVAAVFNDPEQALDSIKKSPPQLLFLDIEMPIMNGFDLLRQLETINFGLIFTTAYDQYAIKAFRFNALDYLLKPVDKDELLAAVNKIKQSPHLDAARLWSAQYLSVHPVPERIALPVGYELLMVDVADILYLKSDGAYVSVYVKGASKPILLAKSLREFEELLNNNQFFRTHNSYLIHLKHIKKVIRQEGSEIVMANGTSVPLARSKRAELLHLLAKV